MKKCIHYQDSSHAAAPAGTSHFLTHALPLHDFNIHILLVPKRRRFHHRANRFRYPALLADDFSHVGRCYMKLFPTTDDVKRFKRLKKVTLDTGKARDAGTVLEIEGVKFFKQFAILKFRGIDSIEDVERYRKASLLVPRSEAVRLKKDEYSSVVGNTFTSPFRPWVEVMMPTLKYSSIHFSYMTKRPPHPGEYQDSSHILEGLLDGA